MKRLFVILIPLLLCIKGSAKLYPMLHYSQENGLPGDIVYDAFQDSKGFIWFGTNAGLVKFNGLKFEHFSTRDGLPDNECFFIREDHQGRFWIATYNDGVVCYQNNIFYNLKNSFPHASAKKGGVRNIKVEQDSSISIVFADGYWWSVKGNHIAELNLAALLKKADTAHVLSYSAIVDVVKDKNDFRVICDNGYVLFDSAQHVKDIRKFTFPHLSWGFSNPEHEYYFSENDIYDEQLHHVSIKLPESQKTNTTFKVSNYDKHYFFATGRGLWIDSQKVPGLLSVSNVFKDRDGNYWITTMGDGIYKLSRNFRNYRFYENVYKGKIIYANQLPEGLFFGTANRNIYRLNGDSVRDVFSGGDLPEHTLAGERSATLYDRKFLFSIGESKYYLLDMKKPGGISHGRIGSERIAYSSALYKAPYIFLFTNSYIDFIRYSQFNDPEHLNRNRVCLPCSSSRIIYSSSQAPDLSIWFSVDDKLFKLIDTVAIVQKQLQHISFRKFTFTNNAMIGYGHDNRFYAVYDYNTPNPRIDSNFGISTVLKNFYRITGNSVILNSNQGYLLITTGISEGKSYCTLRTLEHPSVPPKAEYIFSDGTSCYFFKDRSITKIPVNDLFLKPCTPQLIPGKITAGGREVSAEELKDLPYHFSGNIEISFNVTSFEVPTLECEYSIGPASDTPVQWRRSLNETVALYNIKSGSYMVRIRAKTPGGLYSNTLFVPLNVARPFWLTGWFIVLLFLLLTVVVILLIRYYARKSARVKENEIRFMKSEFIALNALMNPHFIFNALNSVQGLIGMNAKDAAAEYIRTFADLVRQNMQNLSADRITLEKELLLVTNYLKLEQLRLKNRLDFEINIEEDIEPDLILVPPLIIQPLVENAIKHGLWGMQPLQGLIRIDVTEANEMICIDITDNGKGFGKSDNKKAHPSVALSNIESRLNKLASMHGQTITLSIEELKDEAGAVKGVRSSVKIVCPLE